MTEPAPFLSSATRRTLLKVCAIGIIIYSIAVLIFSNVVPHVGLDIFGRVVHRVTDRPVVGPMPLEGDRLTHFAGREINSFPRFVNTLANLRDAHRFPGVTISSVEELSDLTAADVAEIGADRFVKVRFVPAQPGAPPYSSWFLVRDMPWQRSAVSIIWFAVESLIFWMGWLVYRRRPKDDSAALFFLMCIVTVGAYMGGYHWLRIASNPALVFVFALCAMAVPQVSLHFFLVFPRTKPILQRHPRLVALGLYLIPSVLQIAILWVIGAVVSTFRHNLPVEEIDRHLGQLWMLIRAYLFLGGAMFAGCVACLWHTYFHVSDPTERNQVRWILLGALASSLFVSYAFLLAIRDPVEFALGGATWAMFAASLVFTWAYAVSILRYRLLDVEEILQRGLLYLVISFVAGLSYYSLIVLAVWFSPRLASDASHGQALLTPVFVILVFFILSTLRTQIQNVLDRRFFREKHQLERAIRRMDEAVGKLVHRQTVFRRSALVVADAVGASSAAIYWRRGEVFERGWQVGEPAFPPSLPSDHELVVALSAGQLLQTTPGPTLPGDTATLLLRRQSAELAQPLMLESALAGFLLLGPKDVGQYGSEEFEFLQGLAELSTIALCSAETQATLESLNEELREKVARISKQKNQLLAIQTAGTAAADAKPSPDRNGPPPAFLTPAAEGAGRTIQAMAETVRKVAASQATVLIRGESGTGKTMLAEIIHRSSPRANGPFVKVHCAALSPGVLESELFGHVKGAFTGAHRDKTGRFQMAHGGTLFLDEVGDIPLELQTKLLRVLQEMTFEPVGSNESVTVDVRLIAATHQPLEELIRKGRFREDLFYRLNVISIHTPPLRERREDILELSLHFLQRFAGQSGKKLSGLDDEVVEALLDYGWPGNIRELENVIERAVVLANGPLLTLDDLPPELVRASRAGLADPPPAARSSALFPGSLLTVPKAPAVDLSSELDEIERERLREALHAGGGNKSRAAQLLGLPRSTFCSKLKKYGIA